MSNFFNTLNAALEAENLVELRPTGVSIGYGETVKLASSGRFITVYRDERGMYERPIHYKTQISDFQPVKLSVERYQQPNREERPNEQI